MIARRFKTEPLSGVKGIVYVAVCPKHGSIAIRQILFLPKTKGWEETVTKNELIIRNEKDYFVTERLVHLHKDTFGVALMNIYSMLAENNIPKGFDLWSHDIRIRTKG